MQNVTANQIAVISTPAAAGVPESYSLGFGKSFPASAFSPAAGGVPVVLSGLSAYTSNAGDRGLSVVASSLSCRSLSPLSCVVWSRPVVVSRLGWCASSRSVLVWVSGSAAPLSCRVGRSSPAAVSALVASLRSARSSGAPVSLGVRSGWSPSRWFCAVAPASARALAA